MSGQFATGENAVFSMCRLQRQAVDLLTGAIGFSAALLSDQKLLVYDGGGNEIFNNSLSALPDSGISLLVSANDIYTISIDASVLASNVAGTWSAQLVPGSPGEAQPQVCDFQWGGSYNALVYSALGQVIAPFPVPFLSTEKPSISYYAGAVPGGDVLITITDPTGAPVVTAANMTQVGGTDRWDYVLNTAFAVTGLYKVQCLINGDTSSYRTSSFVWASATDPSFGSYQALATTTTATQTLAQALHAKEFNRLKVDTNANTMTLYDVDNTTPLFLWALLPSATNILDRVPD